jgi:hypothetical protein
MSPCREGAESVLRAARFGLRRDSSERRFVVPVAWEKDVFE